MNRKHSLRFLTFVIVASSLAFGSTTTSAQNQGIEGFWAGALDTGAI